MPTLGDLLAAARQRSGSFQAWLEATDPALARQIGEAAQTLGLTPTGYIRVAVADFSRFAPEEDWATITSSMRDSDDPGTICLLGMVHWRLTAKSCETHSHHDHHAFAGAQT